VWVGWFAKHFTHIEIIHWPHDPPLPILHVPRRVIVASSKRAPGDTSKATVVYDPPPEMAVPPPVATEGEDEASDSPSSEEGQPGRLYDRPLSEIVPRLNPLEPRFWRSLSRRGRMLRDRLLQRR
jgi:hypothetical protein